MILDHQVEGLLLEPGSPGQGDGVKLGGPVPHEGRFQDVAALPVDLEQALVGVHVGTRRLEVQRHWENEGENAGSVPAPVPEPRQARERRLPIWQPAFQRGTGL